MNIAALALAALLATQDPSEVDKLKAEVERLRADNAALKAKLETKSKVEQAAPPKAAADDHYRLAENLCQKREIERALEECARALQADPGHLPARTLRTELQFLQKQELEKKDVEMARRKKIWGSSFTEMAAKVTATANEIDLVVLSIGSQLGIAEGYEFTITRKGDFIAKVRIDRVDAQWCAGKVVLKTGDPAVGDDAVRKDPRNAQAAPGLKRPAADEVQSLRKELDEVRNQVRELTDRLVPSYQGAGVSVEEAGEPLREHLGIPRGLVVRQVRGGSAAERAGLMANDVVPGLQEAQLVEAVESGKAIDIVRKGAKLRLKGR